MGSESSEIRLCDDGSLDEIVATGVHVHLEKMANNRWFLSIGEISVWLSSSRKMAVNYEDNRAPQQSEDSNE